MQEYVSVCQLLNRFRLVLKYYDVFTRHKTRLKYITVHFYKWLVLQFVMSKDFYSNY